MADGMQQQGNKRWNGLFNHDLFNRDLFNHDALNCRRVCLSRFLWRMMLVAVVLIGWVGATALDGGQPAHAQDSKVNYTLTDLQFRDFSGKDVSGTSFAAAEMRGANFSGANLRGTILTKGSFIQADLTGADLSEVLGDRVVFNEANLTNAILTDAILTGSIFNDAEITGADFSGALLDRHWIKELCDRAEGINPITGIATRDSLGCR